MLRRQPGYFEADSQGFQRDLQMKELDARIHMALNCGARGCPAVSVYRGASLDVELDEAVAAFVAADANAKKVDIQVGVIHWVIEHARGSKRELLEAAVAPGELAFNFEWLPYDWTTNGPDMPLERRIYTPTL